MHVAITGAAGQVGRIASEAFAPDSRTLFTHREHDDLDAEVLDVTDADAVHDALAASDADAATDADAASDADAGTDVDALLHLAWAPAPGESWDEGHAANVQGTITVLEAALANDLDRVVLASSIHAVGMYNREHADRMESLVADPDEIVAPDDPPRPDSYYGVAKVACEAMGRYYADRYGLDVVCLRIGWVCTEEELRETRADDPDRHRFARATWLSPRDCRAVCRAALTTDLDDVADPAVPLPAVSANADRFQTLAPTMQRLGYRPRDDAAAVLDGERNDGADGSTAGK